MVRGRFITFEGPEGAGKSTQLALLAEWLRQTGVEPIVTREPGGTPMGDRIRAAMFGAQDHGILPLTEALLMSAARAQHVAELLRPALEAGKLVLCDRYADATLAYQGRGRGLDGDMLRQLIAIATGGLQPDLTVYFDVSAEIGLGRKLQAHGRGGELNHLDRMDLDFHERVISGYRELIAAEPARWRVIDANRPVEAIQAAVREATASPFS
ncbi:MAG TPA: dTMP kinase [Chloroflexota bacterium]|nr:dTMP kinase [Chloroflexota bacterium]